MPNEESQNNKREFDFDIEPQFHSDDDPVWQECLILAELLVEPVQNFAADDA